MARVVRTVVKMDEAPKGFTFTAGVVAGTPLDFTGRDDKTVILFNNTGNAAGTAVITAGTGIQGVTDITVEVPVGFSVCALNSGSFKQTKGTNKGDVLIKPSATTIACAVVEID